MLVLKKETTMHNDDPEWSIYAANCIRQMRIQRDKVDLKKINEEEQVFTSKMGGSQIKWVEDPLGGVTPTTLFGNREGWREEGSDSNRVFVVYYEGFGWLSHEELSQLRQEQPRTAP